MKASVICRTLLLGVIVPASYAALYLGLTMPIVTVESAMGSSGEGIKITRSTIQSIEHFMDEGFYLPCSLILFFSIIVPIIKLCTILAVLVCMRVSPAKASRFSFHLRQFAKFQLLDIFVAILMVAFLNQEVISTTLESGFLYYLTFCILSVISAQTLYSIAHNPDINALGKSLLQRLNNTDRTVPLLQAPSAEQLPTTSSSASPLAAIFRFLAGLSLLVGLAGACYYPVLSVKVAFEGSLVLSQSLLSLTAIFSTLLTSPQPEVVAVTVVLSACVIIAPLILLLNVNRKFSDYVSDWAMADVCALAVFTLLVSLNSFGVLMADAPGGRLSGFYFLLMAGFACIDLCMQAHSRMVDAEADALLTVAAGAVVDVVDFLGGVRYECEEAAWTRLIVAAAERTKRPGLMQEAAKRMTGGVLTLKLAGWGVFFTVWAVKANEQVMDLSTVNAQIRQHLPAISNALRQGLPESIGNCTAGAPRPCQGGRESLYYQRTSLYEVDARWIEGLKSTSLHEIYLSVPSKNYMAVAVDGEFGNLPLNLYIGECSTPDVWITGKCRAVWDNKDACCGSRKKFNVIILSQCYPEYPFVRNITVHSIRVDPMHVEEKVMGLVTVSLSDLTDTIQEKLKLEIGPYLNERKFIPWGGGNISLGDLINKILLLNGGENFSCPKPIIGFFPPPLDDYTK